MAERHPGADLATNAAAYYANRGSLAEGTKLVILSDSANHGISAFSLPLHSVERF